MIVHWFKPYTHRGGKPFGAFWLGYRVSRHGMRLCFGVVLFGRVFGLGYRVSRIGWRGEVWRIPPSVR